MASSTQTRPSPAAVAVASAVAAASPSSPHARYAGSDRRPRESRNGGLTTR
jgi:hypothetical protein